MNNLQVGCSVNSTNQTESRRPVMPEFNRLFSTVDPRAIVSDKVNSVGRSALPVRNEASRNGSHPGVGR